MSYNKLTAVLVEAIKELKAENDSRTKESNAKISALEKENGRLRNKIASLESMSERIAALEKSVKTQGRTTILGMK